MFIENVSGNSIELFIEDVCNTSTKLYSARVVVYIFLDSPDYSVGYKGSCYVVDWCPIGFYEWSDITKNVSHYEPISNDKLPSLLEELNEAVDQYIKDNQDLIVDKYLEKRREELKCQI